jgi:N-glycosylase/DNA lyase
MEKTNKYTKLLHSMHKEIGQNIEVRLADFEKVWEESDDAAIFTELVFCIFTPQSKAKSCWAAVERVCDAELLINGSAKEIAINLKGVRFHNTKARRVVEARKHLDCFKARITGFETPFEAREWLVENINGMGYKEASHFLRNIGMGRDLAILDRHILKNLVLLGVIDEIPRHISPKKYLEIEASMKIFSDREKIPMAHLDILLWYRETGEIFK